MSVQCFGQGGGSGGSSKADAEFLPRPGEVPQLADGGRDDMQRSNRCHQQGETPGAASGQEPAGTVEGRMYTQAHVPVTHIKM